MTDSLGGRYGNENDWWPVMLPVEGTEAGLELDIPIDPAPPQVFFRLFKPPTGFGPLD